jgi:hypothetical protein
MNDVEQIQDQLDQKTIEFINYIGQLNKNRFIPFFIFLLKADLGTENTFLNLSSKVQQVLYLLRLFLNKENGDIGDLDYQKIEKFLISIEELYINKFNNEVVDEYYNSSYKKSLAISGTYLNFFLNSSLVYQEQIIDRIQGTFGTLESYILQETGLSIDDYIQFYFETREISRKKFQNCYEMFLAQNVNEFEDGTTCYSKTNALFLPYSLPLKLAISKSDYKLFEADKLDKLLCYFSSYSGDCDNNYYCSPNVLWAKPFISLSEDQYYLPYDEQLLLSIYYFLYKVCKTKNNNIASISRSHFLETKTKHLFEKYFEDYKTVILTNYYLNYSHCEKDILLICKNMVLIIECKSKKYNEPLRKSELSFERIRKDFKESIQDAYRQVKEVEDLFYSKEEVVITDKNRNKIGAISTKKINQVVSIIVTQERFGQIQCDLGLLLNKNSSDCYPWSVSLDDLESILLTFSRKDNPYSVLSTYLTAREKLHERLICFDELDLAGYYLLRFAEFLKACNSDQLFIASSDMCNFFDDLYQSGFGFENELWLDVKIHISISSLLTYELCKKLKLKTPKNICEYKRQNGFSDESMRIFKKMITASPDNPSAGDFLEHMRGRSLSYKNAIFSL